MLAGNLNSSRSYLITAVPKRGTYSAQKSESKNMHQMYVPIHTGKRVRAYCPNFYSILLA